MKSTSRLKALALCAAMLAAAAALGGCAAPPARYPAAERPHYANPAKNLRQVSRVAIIEPVNLSAHPQVSRDLVDALAMTLQQRNLFGVSFLYRQDPSFRSLQLDAENYTMEQLGAIYKALGCDAMLLGNVRQYQPYPRMAVSLRLRLVDLTDGQLIWAMEEAWDSTDRDTQQRFKVFFDRHMKGRYEPLNWEIGMVSPNAFNKFVAYEIGRTIAVAAGAESEYRHNAR